MDKQWEYVDFPLKLGDAARRYACSNLVVLAKTYLDPKYGSMPEDFLDCLRATTSLKIWTWPLVLWDLVGTYCGTAFTQWIT